jgi:hypothetical protein
VVEGPVLKHQEHHAVHRSQASAVSHPLPPPSRQESDETLPRASGHMQGIAA